MSILIPKSYDKNSYQSKKSFCNFTSNPIENKKVLVVGTGSLGGSMIKHISSLGANVIGVNRRGRKEKDV